ncbi:hypothetical protein AUK40_04020 [Candidatus Wirthbacteria bacterium CG2_30_54_11]|uniref:RNase H type-1 domain-containing protein n=1 Tax=Candidatus Wirthbacteria bacterium CG2_30_54_11 TaxID=1817892 RepID=A0A1J5IIX8_9BACT|nr:MAG: hypothetical protein AUK40_04020 [Candidatus Wirthbacteria bacterium CG2_30_54_11]
MTTPAISLITYSDGGARGNPGPAGAGAVVIDQSSKEVLAEISLYLGETTNNQAEYRALIAALGKANELNAQSITCYLDSELIVEQMKGRYKVKNPGLKELYLQAIALVGLKKVSFRHIPREQNSHADRLANEAMDRGR